MYFYVTLYLRLLLGLPLTLRVPAVEEHEDVPRVPPLRHELHDALSPHRSRSQGEEQETSDLGLVHAVAHQRASGEKKNAISN